MADPYGRERRPCSSPLEVFPLRRRPRDEAAAVVAGTEQANVARTGVWNRRVDVLEGRP